MYLLGQKAEAIEALKADKRLPLSDSFPHEPPHQQELKPMNQLSKDHAAITTSLTKCKRMILRPWPSSK